jgi:hypothetical protein
VPAHTKVQKLYFGDDFMLRRLDYVTDVLGGVAAHYCFLLTVRKIERDSSRVTASTSVIAPQQSRQLRDVDGDAPRLAPWRADKMPGGYVVRDANGQARPP